MKKKGSFILKYPPSESCSCEICKSYCMRPGWWTVEQAEKAFRAGLAERMMLEISPERDFGVLSPAFRGCEGNIALKEFAGNGCNFLSNDLCELHGTELLPLECAFCHHARAGLGLGCHADLEKDWHSEKGRRLVNQWLKLRGFDRHSLFMYQS